MEVGKYLNEIKWHVQAAIKDIKLTKSSIVNLPKTKLKAKNV